MDDKKNNKLWVIVELEQDTFDYFKILADAVEEPIERTISRHLEYYVMAQKRKWAEKENSVWNRFKREWDNLYFGWKFLLYVSLLGLALMLFMMWSIR